MNHATPYPPTIIVVHPKEKRSKCTVEPLRGQDEFLFWPYPCRSTERLENYLRLSPQGPPLSPEDADRGLLVLDGTWRWAAVMETDFADVPPRSLTGWTTAYPRVSKIFCDPPQGLATIEAIYAAYHILGRNTEALLDHYHWAGEFLRRNRMGSAEVVSKARR